MTYRLMEERDLAQAVSLYIDYYNICEDGQWTETTALQRMRQVFTREDAYCLVLEEQGKIIAFALGYFEQYDDCFSYSLIEIVVAADKQNKGVGTAFMIDLEKQVKAKGAMLIELKAVKDGLHEHFYSKLGYHSVQNFVLKTKML